MADSSKEDKSKYVTVSMPRDLIEEIEKRIKNNQLLGYANPTQFCTEAVRLRLERYMHTSESVNPHLGKEILDSLDELSRKISSKPNP